MMSSPPLVSIVMAVHNGAATLSDALNSIAQQTHSHYEIILIDDASTDETPRILDRAYIRFIGHRCLVLTNAVNQGLTQSLNQGIAAARGTWIARLDADDRWLPEKLSRQIAVATSTPKLGVIGCWYYNENNNRLKAVRLPLDDAAIKRGMFWRNPFGHSCVLMRTQLLRAVGGYDASLRYAQDRDLWFRLREQTAMANISEFLCIRNTTSGISRRHVRAQMLTSVRLMLKYQRQYQAPWPDRLAIIEPLLVAYMPAWLKRIWR